MVIESFLPSIVQWLKIFNCHTIGDKMLLIAKLVMIKSILSPIVWWLNIFFNRHTFMDLGHQINSGLISPFIWQHNLIWWWNLVCLVMKCRPYMPIFTFFLRCVGLVLFNTNHCQFGREGWNLYGCLNFKS
jgi:hypothetical protein